MLVKFAVKNYRGFKDRIEIDLSKHASYDFNEFVIKDEIIKNGIIYGPNGSGKSNFSLALFDIVYHLSHTWKKTDYYVNFINANRLSESVDFEYTFKFDEDILFYSYSKNATGVLLQEKLVVNNKQIFERKPDYFFIAEEFPMEDGLKENFKHNVNNISVVNFLLTSFPLQKNNPLIKLQTFANSMLWFRNLEVREFIGLELSGNALLDEYIIKNNLVKDFSDFLYQISNQKFDFIEPNPADHYLFCNYNGNKIQFDYIISTGTSSLRLLYFWIKRMNDSSFVFIDEFDAYYHFELSYAVCKYLFSLNCQVFLSSHNTYLMTNDLLRPDCNFIINDNKIKSLNNCTDKDLKFGHNIEKLYRGNTFQL